MKGIVFNIQKFSIHDGPGIRTTVFLKGCPLRCKWCANPESQIAKIQILHDNEKCLHCLACINACSKDAIRFVNDNIIIDYRKCNNCNTCVNLCPIKALTIEGELKSVRDVVDVCLQDIEFYKESNGGVTISGGEGMIHPEFVEELLKELKRYNIHTAIETTGFIKEETFRHLAKMFDLLLFDVKHYDSKKHYEGTNVHNELILDNLKWAIDNNIEVLPRIPVIPDFNNNIDDAYGFSKLFNEINVTKVQLLPFHQFGEKKYDLLNFNYQYKDIKALHKEDLEEYKKVFIDHGINCFF